MTALEYTKRLVAFDSVSRSTNVPVTDEVESILQSLDFEVERLEYDDVNGVRKASVVGKKGSGTGGLAYFGHTDVVPADTWVFAEHGPFEPTEKDGRLYGRGTCDMKGSVACMLAAAAAVKPGDLKRPLYVTCTADEEIGMLGASDVARRSELYAEMVTGDAAGIIGEPTLLEVVYAHKGSYGVVVTSRGRAAHSSTREGVNANLAMIPFLAELKALYEELESDPRWRNDEFDPPTTTMNIGINDHTKAVNITPPQSVCTAYYRSMPDVEGNVILERIRSLAEMHGLELETRWNYEPLYVDPRGPFVAEMLELADRDTAHTVSYGTDGSAFRDLPRRVVYGPGSIDQAHTHDEWISLEQLERGTAAYARLVERFCR